MSPVSITLELTPAAHGLLVAMAAYRDVATVENFIKTQLAESVEAWCEGVSNHGSVQELFLSGKVTVEKEEA